MQRTALLWTSWFTGWLTITVLPRKTSDCHGYLLRFTANDKGTLLALCQNSQVASITFAFTVTHDISVRVFV